MNFLHFYFPFKNLQARVLESFTCCETLFGNSFQHWLFGKIKQDKEKLLHPEGRIWLVGGWLVFLFFVLGCMCERVYVCTCVCHEG